MRAGLFRQIVKVPHNSSAEALGSPLSVLFCGTDAVSVATLSALVRLRKAGIVDTLHVLCPSPRMRHGGRLEKTAVHAVCEASGLAYSTVPMGTKKLPKDPALLLSNDEAAFDLGVTVSFGYRIPNELMELCRFGMLNVHPSLLPRLRGAAPIVRAIAGSDENPPLLPLHEAPSACGVSVIRMTEEMDGGAVLAQEQYQPDPHDTAASMTSLLASRGAELLTECVTAVHRANSAGLTLSDDVFHWQREQSTLPGPPTSSSDQSSWSLARKVQSDDAELRWNAEGGNGALQSPAGLVRKCRSLDHTGMLVGGTLGCHQGTIIDESWTIQLEPMRRGEELKLVAVDYANETDPDTPTITADTPPPSGTLAVTGPKKQPALWVYAGCGWTRILEARIAGRAKMTMPQLIRALGKRGKGPNPAFVATLPALDSGDDRV